MAQKKAPICQATHKSKFGQKKKMPSDDYDPVHQLDSNSETIFLEKGSGISNDSITLFCKSDKVQLFASIYPVQSVTIDLKKVIA